MPKYVALNNYNSYNQSKDREKFPPIKCAYLNMTFKTLLTAIINLLLSIWRQLSNYQLSAIIILFGAKMIADDENYSVNHGEKSNWTAIY